jgi:hypothetical protein
MKILLSAIACNPFLVSENYIGWSAVQCLARDHELWVITGSRNRPDLERAQAEGLVAENVRFVYAGEFKPWHQNRLVARMQGWREYIRFTNGLLPVARSLHKTIRFDLTHHVTFATWRVGSPLWKLGIPSVFGPVGGAGTFPLRLMPVLSPFAAAFESLRLLSGVASRLSPSVRACIRRAAYVLTADSETCALASRIRGSSAQVSCLLHAFHSEKGIKAFARYSSLKELNGPLRLFAGGFLIGTKAVILALRALARVKSKGVQFQYRLGAEGPELPRLRKMAVQLGLGKEVRFGDPLSGEVYARELGATHVFFLPSLRESAGLTMMEAMLAGCVPVVADCGGPGHIVTADCGYKLPISSAERLIEGLADTILTINRNREIIRQKGAAAVERITTRFSEQNYREVINSVYALVTRRSLESQKNPACEAKAGNS